MHDPAVDTQLLKTDNQQSLTSKQQFYGVCTHLHLVSRSRLRGAIHPLPQYAFMAWYSAEAQQQLYLVTSTTYARPT